ncbi:MAG: hypothetical protein IPM57_10010 [Oligoflexia bacterium]|nr:hypothetical protein [Oligoflexia bacterium]
MSMLEPSKKLCNKVTVLFDSDEAGQIAATKSIAVFFRNINFIQMSVLTGAKTLDEYIRITWGRKI